MARRKSSPSTDGPGFDWFSESAQEGPSSPRPAVPAISPDQCDQPSVSVPPRAIQAPPAISSLPFFILGYVDVGNQFAWVSRSSYQERIGRVDHPMYAMPFATIDRAKDWLSELSKDNLREFCGCKFQTFRVELESKDPAAAWIIDKNGNVRDRSSFPL